MNEYKKKIIKLETNIANNEDKISVYIKNIGKELVELAPCKVSGTSLEEKHSKVNNYKKQILEKEKVIEKINKTQSQLEGLKARSAEINKNIQEKEKQNKNIYKEIGELSYSIFNNNIKSLESYREIFFELIELDDKIKQYNDNEISEDSKPGFIAQIFKSAKSILLKQKYKLTLLKYPSLYRKAGDHIISSNFIQETEDSVLKDLLKTVHDSKKEIKELQEELKHLNKEKENTLFKLKSFDAKKKPNTLIHEIEKEINEIKVKIEDLYSILGTTYINNSLNIDIKKETINRIYKKISNLKKDNQTLQSEIDKLNILLQINKLEDKIEKGDIKVKQKKSQLLKIENDIESIQNELADIEKEKKSLNQLLNKKEKKKS